MLFVRVGNRCVNLEHLIMTEEIESAGIVKVMLIQGERFDVNSLVAKALIDRIDRLAENPYPSITTTIFSREASES